MELIHAARFALRPLSYVVFCLALVSLAGHALAEERVGVGSLTPRARAELGSSVTVIDREEIERRGVPFASDLLREVPGVAVSRSGSFGSLTQVRIRGAEGNHTLVLIDGVEVNDPALNNEFDFGNLLTDDIERIEVLRGPQSALYGSESIGGVINVVTREMPEGAHGAVSAEAGSFGTRRVNAILGGGGVDWRLTGSVNFLDTHGISDSPMGGERDGFRNHTYNLRGSARLAPFLEVGGTLRYGREDHERDTQNFSFPAQSTDGLVVNSFDHSDSEQGSGRAWAQLSLLDGHWTHRLDASKLDTKRDERDAGLLLSETRGDKRRYRYQTSVALDALGLSHTLTGAFEHEENRFDNRAFDPGLLGSEQSRKIDEDSWIGEYRVGWGDALFLSGSVRHDDNDRFDDATSWRTTLSYTAPWRDTRFHASWGEGVQNPGMFELFGFFSDFFRGNPDLKPETSEGWEVGFEHEFGDVASFGLTYFESDLEDEIDGFLFVPSTGFFTADNIDGRSEREGVEALLRLEPWAGFQLTATYSYVDSEDPDGEREIRRPKHTGSVAANLRFLRDKANLNLAVLYNGNQRDNEFVVGTPETEVVLGAYTLVQLRGSYRINEQIEIFGRIENLLDDDYHEIEGFETPGFGAFGGLRFRY